jgi:hypothetical protein
MSGQIVVEALAKTTAWGIQHRLTQLKHLVTKN